MRVYGFAAFSLDLTPIISTNQVAFYGLSLNNSTILEAIGFGTPPTTGVLGVYQNLHNICIGNLIISAAGLIPGYYFTFLFIDRWGRKPIQLMGFIMLFILFLILGELFVSFFSCPFFFMPSKVSPLAHSPRLRKRPKFFSSCIVSRTSSKISVPTPPLSLSLVKFFLPVTVPPHTVSLPQVEKLAPLLPRLAFHGSKIGVARISGSIICTSVYTP
jgi:hypothetical protein